MKNFVEFSKKKKHLQIDFDDAGEKMLGTSNNWIKVGNFHKKKLISRKYIILCWKFKPLFVAYIIIHTI